MARKATSYDTPKGVSCEVHRRNLAERPSPLSFYFLTHPPTLIYFFALDRLMVFRPCFAAAALATRRDMWRLLPSARGVLAFESVERGVLIMRTV